MIRDFKERIEYLKGRWQDHTPKGYHEVKDQWLTLLDTCLRDIRLLPELLSEEIKLDKDRRIEAYKNVWNYLTRLEDVYENAAQSDAYEFENADKLLARYAELENDKKKFI